MADEEKKADEPGGQREQAPHVEGVLEVTQSPIEQPRKEYAKEFRILLQKGRWKSLDLTEREGSKDLEQYRPLRYAFETALPILVKYEGEMSEEEAKKYMIPMLERKRGHLSSSLGHPGPQAFDDLQQ